MKPPFKKIEYDSQVDALYVSASSAKVKKTVKLTNRLFLDIDRQGKIVGIEILDVSKPLPQSLQKSLVTTKVK